MRKKKTRLIILKFMVLYGGFKIHGILWRFTGVSKFIIVNRDFKLKI